LVNFGGDMPIVDSKTGKIRKNYSVDELVKAANLMRGYNMISLCVAGSGHSGGTISIMDVTAALYLDVATHDPKDPFWDGRDRIIWSTAHKAPSLYLGLGMGGYYDVEKVVKLRKLYSPFQVHPHWLKLLGAEASTGSLGQGFSEDSNKEKICFIIGPIGNPDGDTRKRADLLFHLVINPAVEECEYKAVRADMLLHTYDMSLSGEIIKHVEEDPMLVADLTGHNPNVMYELGYRFALRKPTILLIDHKQELPFYFRDKPVFFLDLSDIQSINNCKKFIIDRIKHFEKVTFKE
jgi:hypothetical protein